MKLIRNILASVAAVLAVASCTIQPEDTFSTAPVAPVMSMHNDILITTATVEEDVTFVWEKARFIDTEAYVYDLYLTMGETDVLLANDVENTYYTLSKTDFRTFMKENFELEQNSTHSVSARVEITDAEGKVFASEPISFKVYVYDEAVPSVLSAKVSEVVLDKNDPEESERQKAQCQEMYEMSRAWDPKAQFLISVHAIYSVREPMMLWAVDFARERGLKIHIHISETRKEVEDCMKEHGMSPVEYLDSLGVLGPDVIAAHTLWLSENDVRILGERGVTCVHNINSNLKLASGYRFLYNELKAAGANVCLGTDGCGSSNNLDILEAMKTSAIVQKAWRDDPSAMPLGELAAMVSTNAAKALGINAGQIKEGMLADLLIIDIDNYQFLSPAGFLANLVYSAHSDCVDSVICDGKFIMRGRVVEGEREIIENARKQMNRVWIHE